MSYEEAYALACQRILNGTRANALAAEHSRDATADEKRCWPRWQSAEHWFNFLQGIGA